MVSLVAGASHRSRPTRIVGRRVLLLAAFLSLSVAGDGRAQHISGRLVDLATTGPIPAGLLKLLAADSSVLSITVSDQNGFWRLDMPGPGVYYVAAERLGYVSWLSKAVTVGPDDELSAVFHLPPAPLRLDPIEVRARAIRQYLELSGFYERQRGNFGHFVTPEAIDRRQAARVTDLLISIPGVQRVYVSGGSAGPSQVQLRGSSLSQGGVCRPRVYVDGLMYSAGDSRPVRDGEGVDTELQADLAQRMDQALSLDDIAHPSALAGIEVYRSASQVPVRFGGGSVETLCGVIVIWTRSGRVRGGG